MAARRAGRVLAGIAYSLSLAAISTVIAFVAAILLWEWLDLSRATGFRHDVTFLAMPPGFALGILVARATRQWTLLHWSLVAVGVLLPLVALVAAGGVAERARALADMMGPLSGFSESIGRIMVHGLRLFGVVALAAGIAGIVLSSPAKDRSLSTGKS